MEDPAGKVLSCEEKEKLKEKLAFLKREYSKTLARLQRAQRAEKAKNSMKSEQNYMLKEETSIQTNKEPKDKVSFGDKLETCTLQINACVDVETKEKTAITLDFEPEVLSIGDGSSGMCPENIDDDCQENFLSGITGPDNEKKQSKQPLNRMKNRKKTLLSKGNDSFFDSDSLIKTGQKQVFAIENSELPVFQRRNQFSCSKNENQNSPRPIKEINERLECVASTTELEKDTNGILKENNLPKMMTFSLHNPLDDDNIEQLGCVPLEEACDNYKLATKCSVNLIHTSPKKLEEGRKEYIISPDDQMVNNDMNVDKKKSSNFTLPADEKAFSVNELNHSLSENIHFKEQNQSLKLSESFSNLLDSRGENLQKKEILSETMSPTTQMTFPDPTENPLNSCTVLDGLPFPVEYYVRTTRRMSSCQKTVDLEAVIQSQLSVKRKGFKQKSKQITKNLDLSSQEAEQSEFLLSDPWSEQVISSSPFQKSFSSSIEGSPPALPTKDNDYVVNACKRQSNRRHREKSFCKKGTGDQDSELQVFDELDIKKPKEDVALCKEAPRTKEYAQSKKKVTKKSSCTLANVGKKVPTSMIQGKQDYIQNKNLHSSFGNDSLIVDNTSFDLSFHLKNMILGFEKLSSNINITDFHLPDEDFGSLKLEKLKSFSAKQIESFESGDGEKKCNDGNCLVPEELVPKNVTEKENLVKDVITLTRNSQPKKPKSIPSNILLFTPSSTALPATNNHLEASVCSPVFPILGTTPVFGSQVHSENMATEIIGPTFCTPKHSYLKEPESLSGYNQCNSSPNSLKLTTNMHLLDREVKKKPDQTVSCSETKFDGDCSSQETLPAVKTNAFKETSLLGSTFQTKAAEEHPAEIWCDSLKLGNLQLVSKLKNPSDSCSVDVSTVWWEVTGCKESCIITACEFTVSLWKSLDNWQWRKVYTWHFTEIPVLQIVPLLDACNLVCVALGHLEIREIRLLFCSNDDECLKQSLVKSGNIKAVLGLRHKRLVCSNGTLHDHQVDLMTFSESGRSKEKQTLMSPEETILAFAEIQGMQDALLGTTLTSNIVIWNLKTGQLLKKMQIGNSYQASICHKAYSDMGLLFVVLSHPHGKEIESMGSPIFRLIVINPKTALSVDVRPYSLPQGHTGRFLDGEVKDNLAAAVLTSGTVAVWDLFLGHCTALLLPNSDGNWSFVKWSDTDSCLLAGQKNGSVFVYSYI
ncbi:partner and localizer of BRCA2 [Gracilinanus agilis]|uniref:partner and localizer of BRCA2 n=1 Tax=Gracilinanus agilis TaxID=191870 RepID=UPI001CFCCB2C|nr:partner and localizer of BRCA2 [Gracilinanus agilis]